MHLLYYSCYFKICCFIQCHYCFPIHQPFLTAGVGVLSRWTGQTFPGEVRDGPRPASPASGADWRIVCFFFEGWPEMVGGKKTWNKHKTAGWSCFSEIGSGCISYVSLYIQNLIWKRSRSEMIANTFKWVSCDRTSSWTDSDNRSVFYPSVCSSTGKHRSMGPTRSLIYTTFGKMGGTSKSSIYRLGFSTINHPAIGVSPHVWQPPFVELSVIQQVPTLYKMLQPTSCGADSSWFPLVCWFQSLQGMGVSENGVYPK